MGDAQSIKKPKEVEPKTEKTESPDTGNENEGKMEDTSEKKTDNETETEINLNEDNEDNVFVEQEASEKEKSPGGDDVLDKDRKPSIFDSFLNIFSETFAISKQDDNAPSNPEQETPDEEATNEHDEPDKTVLVEEDIEIVVMEEAKPAEDNQEKLTESKPKGTLIERLQSLFRDRSRERGEKVGKNVVVYNAEDDTITAEKDPVEGDAKTDPNEGDEVAKEGTSNSCEEAQDGNKEAEETAAVKAKHLKKLLPCCKQKSEN